jgi:hypothetical protein
MSTHDQAPDVPPRHPQQREHSNSYSPRHPHEPEIPPALDAEGRCLICGLFVERDRLQQAVDRAHAAMVGSQHVGGPTQREAWQTAVQELGAVVTQHVGQGEQHG